MIYVEPWVTAGKPPPRPTQPYIVGSMETKYQSVVMLCGLKVKAGMAHHSSCENDVYDAGKTVVIANTCHWPTWAP